MPNNSKLTIYHYRKDFPKKFLRYKEELAQILPVSAEIHHVGSTAVPGLKGKGIIDILIGLSNWRKEKELVSNLGKIGYGHIHPRERGRIHASLTDHTDIGDAHLHIVIKGSAEYKRMLFFRDQLIKQPSLLKEYQKIKESLAKDKNQTRKTYSAGKNEFIKRVISNI